MLETPLGAIRVFLDNEAVDYQLEQVSSNTFPNVTTFNLRYRYVHDGKTHTLKCLLCDTKLKGNGEGGQRLETIAFESVDPPVRLSIGIGGEFLGYVPNENGVLEPCYEEEYQYEGSHLENGLELQVANEDFQEFIFRVAWMYDFSVENSHHTWLMADPSFRN